MDDNYYRTGFEYPPYLQKSIDDLVWGEEHDPLMIDCYESDLIASINIALIEDHAITAGEAKELRRKYLHEVDE